MSDKDWWRGAVFYQIYPRSFFDKNNDGTGDLAGITEKLPYIADLGVEAVWISPFFKSPQADFGYDVSDYLSVDPIFGTNEDFDVLLEKAHSLGLKIIVDLVLSHTSIQHPWFQESRQNTSNEKADWYVWADAKEDGSPPNNWQSLFGGPAWEFDTRRGQYYLHNFLKEQPDLNFHNPDVKKAALDNCRFWLEKGVDGFRLDVINFLYHNQSLKNNPPRGLGDAHMTPFDKKTPYSMQIHENDLSQPETLEFLKEFRKMMDEYPDKMTLGEIDAEDPFKTAAEYAHGSDRLNTCYNTNFMSGQLKSFCKQLLTGPILEFMNQPFKSWPTWAFSNHDVVRAASRWGQAKSFDTNPDFAVMLMVLLCSLRGTAFIYQGDELGLIDAKIDFEDIQDPWGKYLWPEWQGRDGCRTPIPWDSTKKHAGFSEAEKCWLPVYEHHYKQAVNLQREDKHSVLNRISAFLKWRKEHITLIKGDIAFFDTENDTLLAFEREFEGEKILCLFNLGDEKECFKGENSYGEYELEAFEFLFVKNGDVIYS